MQNLREQAETLVKTRITGTRKGMKDIPAYIHSFRVCETLERHGCAPDVILAGLLHDVIEDGGVTAEELKAMGYSERTIRLVQLCTHSVEVKDKTERWLLMIEKLVEANDKDAWMIKTADLLDNLRESHGLTEDNRRFMVEVKAPLLLRLTASKLGNHALWNELQEEAKRQKVAVNLDAYCKYLGK